MFPDQREAKRFENLLFYRMMMIVKIFIVLFLYKLE